MSPRSTLSLQQLCFHLHVAAIHVVEGLLLIMSPLQQSKPINALFRKNVAVLKAA